MNVRTCFIVSSVVILSTYLWHNISYGIPLAENGYRYPVPTAFFQCKYIYVDMGANIGVHSRFLFEPEKYPPKIKRFHLKEMYELFDKHFGVPSARKEPNFKSKICVFGFEASPTESKVTRMNALNKAYNERGWAVHYRAGTAVWHKEEQIQFFVDNPNVNEFGTGNSIYSEGGSSWFGGPKKVSVPTINMVKFVQNLYKKYKPELVIGKMDIEGGEFDLLPKLEENGILCSSTGFDIITIEYHKRIFKNGEKDNWKVPVTHECPTGSKTKFLELDVEEYHNDPVPLV
jgi:hypothetical protein|eukprot:g9.t1